MRKSENLQIVRFDKEELAIANIAVLTTQLSENFENYSRLYDRFKKGEIMGYVAMINYDPIGIQPVIILDFETPLFQLTVREYYAKTDELVDDIKRPIFKKYALASGKDDSAPNC